MPVVRTVDIHVHRSDHLYGYQQAACAWLEPGTRLYNTAYLGYLPLDPRGVEEDLRSQPFYGYRVTLFSHSGLKSTDLLCGVQSWPRYEAGRLLPSQQHNTSYNVIQSWGILFLHGLMLRFLKAISLWFSACGKNFPWNGIHNFLLLQQKVSPTLDNWLPWQPHVHWGESITCSPVTPQLTNISNSWWCHCICEVLFLPGLFFMMSISWTPHW